MTGWLGAAGVALRETVSDLAALVLPVTCPGCGRDVSPPSARFCPACAGVLAAAVPGPVSPSPVPAGMPPCAALAPYDGVLREAILAYKERGRHDLARPLAGLLAAVVSAGSDRAAPLVLVPVPATASAARERFGDHMARLAGHAVRTLRTAGWSAVVSRPLRALPRPDSATLDTAGRARAAADAFRVRARAVPALRRAAAAGARVVVVDDIVTTGATLAAVARALAAAGVPVARAAVLAATQRRLAAGQGG
ncbi:MAG: phosphoribosyltransferase family protein [Micromonosporaceae bacterium]